MMSDDEGQRLLSVSDQGSIEIRSFDSSTGEVPPGGKAESSSVQEVPVFGHSSDVTFRQAVSCMVCLEKIDVRGKERQFVVRCGSCNEVTPIRPAPAGKKYVRCVCNCLLICHLGSMRLICPRENCHRILDLNPFHQPDEERMPAEGEIRIACIFCERNFLVDVKKQKIVRCPHCQKKSAVCKQYVHRCCIIYAALAAIAFFVALGTVIGTVLLAGKYTVLYALYICMFAVSVALAMRAYYFYRLPVSPALGPASVYGGES